MAEFSLNAAKKPRLAATSVKLPRRAFLPRRKNECDPAAKALRIRFFCLFKFLPLPIMPVMQVGKTGYSHEIFSDQ